MLTIYDLVDSKAIGAYVEEIYSNSIPDLGETLFPRRKKLGLDLKWIKGYNQVPVSLMPSAFDAKPTLRDRIGLTEVQTEMPFFREAMRFGEKDRQELLRIQDSSNMAYLRAELDKIFDDRANLVAGADVVPERMRMSLLIDGKINIVAPDDKGIVANYAYDYDKSGQWKDQNTKNLTVAGGIPWTDTKNANPVIDLLNIKRQMKATKGVILTRAIVTTATWALLLQNEKIKLDMNVQNGQNIILTDGRLRQYLIDMVDINFTVYDKIYKDADLTDHQFYANGYCTLLPDGMLGNTWYGTTPEEADLMAGNVDADVTIVRTGVAILTKKESLPVNIITSVSEIVLPSFERMADVFTLKVADMKDDPAWMLPGGDGYDYFNGAGKQA